MLKLSADTRIISLNFQYANFKTTRNKIYMGEMTFTSLGGLMDFFTEDFQNLAGSKIDINYSL